MESFLGINSSVNWSVPPSETNLSSLSDISLQKCSMGFPAFLGRNCWPGFDSLMLQVLLMKMFKQHHGRCGGPWSLLLRLGSHLPLPCLSSCLMISTALLLLVFSEPGFHTKLHIKHVILRKIWSESEWERKPWGVALGTSENALVTF